MGKTRSSRRMRNCKSRNKRVGGGFRFFISPEKLEFKRLQELKGAVNKDELRKHIVDLVNKSPNEIPLLYDDLNLHDKDKLRRCIIDGLKNDEIDAVNIRDLSTDFSDTKKGIISTAVQEKKEEQKTNQGVTSDLAPFGIGHQEEPSTRITHKSDTVLGPRISNVGPGGFFNSRAHKSYESDVEGYMLEDPSTPSSGGKSRRRHRRGRTLHKRRKSSKVRKMRCTRTRSRSRR